MEKIKLTQLSGDDIHLISEATNHYAGILKQLCVSENKSQQHIHLSILEELQFELLKMITKREKPKSITIKMEVHTAFVLYDALDNYGRDITSLLTSAITRRILMDLFPLLPYTKDHWALSLESNLHQNNA